MKNYIDSERADLFEPNIYINFLVQVTGSPSSEELKDAIEVAFNINEATMSKIVIDNNGNAYYEKMIKSGCKVFITEESWRNIIKNNEKNPFAIDKGELIRVFIITCHEETYLLIIAHHLVGDGKSITYFIEDVMMSLCGNSLEYKPMKLIKKDSLLKEGISLVPFKLYANLLNKRWKKTGRKFNWNEYYDVHNKYWSNNSSEILFESFSEEEVRGIYSYVKNIGVTVNSYILAAFFEADKKNRTIGMAVDARLDKNKSMSNQATGISVDHKFCEKSGFDDNLIRIHRKVVNKLKKPEFKYFILKFIPLFTPSLIDSILLYTHGLYQNKTTEKLAKVMGYAGDKVRGLGITNLTKLDIPSTYGKYGIKSIVFIPPVVSYADHIVGICTLNNKMTITYHFMNHKNKNKESEFFKKAIYNIRNFSNGT